MSSTHDKAEGKMHEIKGKIVEKTGEVLGNEKMEAEGKEEKIDGENQHKVGQIKAVFGK